MMILGLLSSVGAQNGGGHMLYGDFKIDESKVTGPKPLSFDLLLYTSGGRVVGRQSVVSNSHYRFMDVSNGDYDLVVEVEGAEVARIHVLLNEIFKTDIRQDIALEWHGRDSVPTKPRATSVEDLYKRTARNQKRFEQAEATLDRKDFKNGINQLEQLLADDPGDYQAWTELGTAYLLQKNPPEAEKSYLKAIEVRPTYLQAMINLGRLRLSTKDFAGAIEVLSRAVSTQAQSADANYYLGEAYLQIKKGSKAVGYLYEALKLDPIGKAEAHLRLAALYNAAGMKDKAAIEYEQFLKKKPDYPEKEKLQQYVVANKKN
jgi:tetratricopeptide (TPR) repeat protein